MASILSSRYQPSPRFHHYAVQVGSKSYMWGGRTQDFLCGGQDKLKSTVNVFDPYRETWQEQPTTGVSPRGLYYGAAVAHSTSLYSFAGADGKSWQNSLHVLDTDTLVWKEIPSNSPMPKSGCGMVFFGTHHLATIGGYSQPTQPIQTGSSFVKGAKYSEGWTDEFHVFDVAEGKWSSPTTTGPRPPPSSAFTFTAVNHHKAVYFGGAQPGRGGVNDVYVIDFDSMQWTKLEREEGAPWPVGRCHHAACCLNYEDDQPVLLMTGGIDNNGNTLTDAWMLDINTVRWRKLTLPEGTQPRCWHTLTAFKMDQGRVHATTFGGCSRYIPGEPDDDRPKLADTTVLEFESVQSGDSPSSRQWVLVGVADSSQLGSPERTKELDKLKQKITERGYLRSVEVLGHTSFTYTGRAQSFEWVDHGFKIHFPENALPSDVDECRVHVTASLSGQFQFPDDTELISGIYWIATPHEFTKPVTVDIQHCSTRSTRTDHPSSLMYIVAKCTQEDLPYMFNPLNGGVFAPSSRYGSISLTHFSGLGIASRSPRRSSLIQRLVRRRPQDESEISNVKSYCARLYYRSSGILSWEVLFAIMWNLEIHIEAVNAGYAESNARMGPYQEVMFEGERITLDIPMEGIVLENGWTISPDTYPGITKHQVDEFVPGRLVPSCQLYAKWTGQREQPVELVHRVKLLGAKEPFNFFSIRPPSLTPQPQVPQSGVTGSSPSKPQLKDLMDALYHKVADKWELIGVFLEISRGTLAGITEKCRDDPHRCLVKMLDTWLEQIHPPASWAIIVEAVEFLGEKQLGRELRDKYTCM